MFPGVAPPARFNASSATSSSSSVATSHAHQKSSQGTEGRYSLPMTARSRVDVPVSTFSYLFSELVQYSQSKVSNVGDLERRLEEVGQCVGVRLLEILTYRERAGRRETRLLDILRFVHTSVWKYMFGRQASDLEQSNTMEDEYMIRDSEIFVSKYISVPKEMGTLSCNAFMAGIIKGVLDGSGFPARVTAHYVHIEGSSQPKITMLMKFDQSVLEREKRLGGSSS